MGFGVGRREPGSKVLVYVYDHTSSMDTIESCVFRIDLDLS